MSIDLAPIVSATSLSLRYGDVHPLRGVSFSIPKGAVVGIAGRNGAGKTTLLQVLLELFGCASRALNDEAKAKLGYVAQSPELFESMRVRDQLDLYRALYPTWSSSRADALAARFDLNPKARTRSLSIGERQRLAIVLALSHSPELLILDEPVASLDPLSRRDFLRTLFEGDGADSQRTVLLSSHLLEDLERIVSHMIFMRDGEVQLYASVEEIEAHIRVVELKTRLESAVPGILHQSKWRNDHWRTVVDSRFPEANVLIEKNGGVALSVSDLFIALNQS
jgi:ABC-2 type transport system ATP-binding protein